jgi:hypothetical protein
MPDGIEHSASCGGQGGVAEPAPPLPPLAPGPSPASVGWHSSTSGWYASCAPTKPRAPPTVVGWAGSPHTTKQSMARAIGSTRNPPRAADRQVRSTHGARAPLSRAQARSDGKSLTRCAHPLPTTRGRPEATTTALTPGPNDRHQIVGNFASTAAADAPSRSRAALNAARPRSSRPAAFADT